VGVSAAGDGAAFAIAELADAGMKQPADKVNPTKKGGKPKAKKGGKSKGKGKGKKKGSKKKGKKKGSKKKGKKSGKPNKNSKPPQKREKDDRDGDGPPEGPLDDHPLGMVYGECYLGDDFSGYLRDLNLKRCKTHVYWQHIEPEKDVYNFAIVDTFLEQLDEDAEVIVEVYTGSDWATEANCKGSPPLDFDEYYDFIYDLVLHCDGRVKYWQRDGEPFSNDIRWPSERWMDYIETQHVFYDAVKAADPDALVVGVGHSGHWSSYGPSGRQCFELLLQYGKDWFDIVDLHLYYEVYDVPEKVKWFADKMNEYGYQKPIFATEYGGPHPCAFEAGWEELSEVMREWSYHRLLSDEDDRTAWWKYLYAVKDEIKEPSARMFLGEADPELEDKHFRILARDIVQRTALALEAGVEGLWYWSLHAAWHPGKGPHPYFGKLRMADLRLDYKAPAFEIYSQMAAKYDGYQSIERIDTGDEEIYLFRIERESKEPLFVLWEKRDIYDGETLPAVEFTWVFPWTSVAATDVFGNVATHYERGGCVTLDITDTPLFLEAL